MFPASLLILMILLLPHTSSGHQESPGQSHGHLARHLDPSLAQTIQKLLLTRLGLQTHPSPSQEARVPQYILDLYRFHTQQFHLIEDPAFSYPSQHVQRANTVRCFHHTEPTKENPRGDPETTMDRIHVGFNLSSIPPDESVVSGELRFLREKPSGSPHLLSLYLSNPADPESTPRLLQSRRLTGDADGPELWETFPLDGDVFQSLSGDKPAGLSFALHVTSGNDSLPADQHLRLRRSAGQDESSWVRQRPLLVTYGHDGRNQALVPLRKRRPAGRRAEGRWRWNEKREAEGRWSEGQRRGRWNEKRVKRNGGRAAKLKRLSRSRCRRHPLYVDFKDVGWNKWIVAPSGYDAFFCLGECRFPLADHMNSSSHAMVQTLVHSVNGAVPKACCVPTALSPIALLYLDQEERVVLKNYQDMVVEGCGCR